MFKGVRPVTLPALVVGVLCILWRRSFVGTKSCMIRYQVILVDSDTGASLRFPHTRAQSMCCHFLCTPIFNTPVTARCIVFIVVYNRFLYAFIVSMFPLGTKYADSLSNLCKYSSFAGFLLSYRGFFVCSRRPYLPAQSAVTVPGRMLCSLMRLINSARHFAAGLIRSQHPSLFVRCKVDNGTINVSPFHKNQDTVKINCLRLSIGGSMIWGIHHTLTNIYNTRNTAHL